MAGEEYVPLGGTDFSSIITKIKIAHPDVIFSTLNGDSNVSFFKQLAAAGITQAQLPVMSFSIAEQEAKAMGPSLVNASYAAWNYFQSLNNPANKKFIAAYTGEIWQRCCTRRSDGAWIYRCIIWAAAVKKADSFDPQAVRKAATQLGWTSSPMGQIKFADNQSLYQTAYVGQLQPDGQFKILWQSKKPLRPEPSDRSRVPGQELRYKVRTLQTNKTMNG